MKVHMILAIISIILFVLSIGYWFTSGVVRKRKPDSSKNYDKIGGFMFATSLLLAILAVLLWFIK